MRCPDAVWPNDSAPVSTNHLHHNPRFAVWVWDTNVLLYEAFSEVYGENVPLWSQTPTQVPHLQDVLLSSDFLTLYFFYISSLICSLFQTEDHKKKHLFPHCTAALWSWLYTVVSSQIMRRTAFDIPHVNHVTHFNWILSMFSQHSSHSVTSLDIWFPIDYIIGWGTETETLSSLWLSQASSC